MTELWPTDMCFFEICSNAAAATAAAAALASTAEQRTCFMLRPLTLVCVQLRPFHTHTHTRLTALFQDYPGEPVPER